MVIKKGDKNSQYNTCWVYNETTRENKRIDKKDLEYYLQIGYVKGRKLPSMEKSPYDDIFDVNEIRTLKDSGLSIRKIAKQFNVPPSTMNRFLRRHSIM